MAPTRVVPERDAEVSSGQAVFNFREEHRNVHRPSRSLPRRRFVSSVAHPGSYGCDSRHLEARARVVGRGLFLILARLVRAEARSVRPKMAVANIGGGPTTTALVAVTFLVASVVSWSGTGTPAGFVEVRGENAGCVGLGLSHGEWSTDTSGCLVDAKDEDDRDASWDGPAAGCFSYDDEFNDEFNDEPPALWRFALDLKRRCGLHTETEQWNAFVGKKVTVVGDSVARHVYASVLRLAAVDGDAFYLSTKEKHRDW
jgi:hypothetical protein